MTLFKRAEINPTMLKLNSVAEQSESPAMIGRRERFTNKVDLSPVKQHKTTADNKQGEGKITPYCTNKVLSLILGI